MNTQIVLVPGFWLGAWAWDEVAPRLRDRGFAVDALTLPGLSETSPDPSATVDQQADAIVAALDPQAARRVLVVHSGAAVPGTVVLDRDPTLVDHVVYVDTAPVADGYAINAELDDDSLPLAAVYDAELEDGSMRDLTDAQLQTFRDRAVPQPGATVREPVVLRNDARLDVPGTVICTAFPSSDYTVYAAQGAPFLRGLTEFRRLELVDLPTGHWPMWSKPAELAAAIATAAGFPLHVDSPPPR
ncbi:alpha/beta fold hydrolase [Knoellia sp. LjRoot47]|uniref:alpha/beta fold hydrolase n=1 Tax=Knoellia sp. LjRoot47 TaxID=3342330 RepID=UPI003ECD6829